MSKEITIPLGVEVWAADRLLFSYSGMNSQTSFALALNEREDYTYSRTVYYSDEPGVKVSIPRSGDVPRLFEVVKVTPDELILKYLGMVHHKKKSILID